MADDGLVLNIFAPPPALRQILAKPQKGGAGAAPAGRGRGGKRPLGSNGEPEPKASQPAKRAAGAGAPARGNAKPSAAAPAPAPAASPATAKGVGRGSSSSGRGAGTSSSNTNSSGSVKKGPAGASTASSSTAAAKTPVAAAAAGAPARPPAPAPAGAGAGAGAGPWGRGGGSAGRGRGRGLGRVGVLPAAPQAPAAADEGTRESPFASLVLASGAETFEAMPGLPAWVAKAVQQQLGFERPTTVQLACCEALLGPSSAGGADVLVRAATGSGKTLAYLAPLVGRLIAAQAGPNATRIERGQGTRALVLVPTRELAAQVEAVAVKLARPFPWLVCGRLTGGEKRKAEKARLRKGVVLLVATPGRLLDHLQHTSALELAQCGALVLDEADRLLDLGFERDLRAILEQLAARVKVPRHTVLCSATLRPELAAFAQWALRSRPRPLFIDADRLRLQPHAAPVPLSMPPQKRDAAADQQEHEDKAEGEGEDQSEQEAEAEPAEEAEEEASAPAAAPSSAGAQFVVPPGLTQHYAVVPSRLRLVALTAFLRQQLDARAHVLVFVSTAASVEFFHALLPMVRVPLRPGRKAKAPAEEAEAAAEAEEVAVLDRDAVWRLHGNLAQAERAAAVRGFAGRKGGAVLVCTDVAARGLDLPAVRWVLQLDAPTDPAEYVHRVGRTARLGARGSSLLFLLPSERAYVDSLAKAGLRLAPLDLVPTLRVLNPTLQTQGAGASEEERAAFLELAMAPLQMRFERLVAADAGGVAGLARSAFKAFVRSYATHSRDARDIFHVRRLHLGHVAKSFALRDAPAKLKQLGAKLSSSAPTTKSAGQHKDSQQQQRRRHVPADEFADGIAPASKKRKS